MNKVIRSFVQVEGRLVHLRMAGQGKPVVLLHQSPRSSAELEPLIAQLATRYLVIAPDTPGNGQSTPLPDQQPEIEAFADNLAGVLSALGIACAGVYGYHTGAAIGAAFALRYPQRAAWAVLNGLPSFTAAERADLLAHYLPPFSPRWDGGHLTWLWARLREQTIHFPWYRAQPDARMGFDVPPPAALDAAVRDFLEAGDHYRAAYGAAFRQEASAIAPKLTCPTMIVATPRDPLGPHLERFGNLPDNVRVVGIEPGQGPLEAIIDRCMARAQLPVLERPEPAPAERSYASGKGGQVHIRRFETPCASSAAAQRPLILIDGRFGSSAVIAPYAAIAARQRRVIAPCLPGCGLSDLVNMSSRKLAQFLGLPDAEVRVLGCSERSFNAAPDATGAHLLRAWHRVRSEHLFAGDGAALQENIRWGHALPDLATLQNELVALLQRRADVVTAVKPQELPSLNEWRAEVA
jgi:pimeloyl-ACP methyl ester carboxylesterase